MCVCTITAQQLELDLAHTLKTPSVATPSNDLFLPTEENFKAAVDQTLNDSTWFREWAEGIITANADTAISQMVEEDVSSFFRNNFDASDYFDIDEAVDNVLSNYNFDDEIESRVDSWLSANLEVDDAVNDAVNSYFDNTVDVDEVAKQNITEILKQTDFIEALAIEIVRQQNHKETQPFIEALAAEMLRQQQRAQPAQTQGETNENVY